MKIWLDKSYNFREDSNVRVGVDWYKHSERHPWKGFTFELRLFKYWFVLNYVSNFYIYDRIVNRRKKYSEKFKRLSNKNDT